MDSNHYKKYEPIFGAWHIVREIGTGSFGTVYEIQREDFGRTYKAALKAITIPQNQSEVKSVMSDGMDEKSASAYFCSFVEEMVDEFALMSKLKGNSNIVSYENHTVIEHSEGIGWDILIQMELLTPLLDYIQEHPLGQEDVVRFGIDICRALELCKKHNIIHRDIKPENIFVSENGDFKLGDFGIARTVEKTTSGLSKKGTYNYMAPEIYKGEAYGTSVDIYSLGLVLYWLLNRNRGPFLPPFPQPLTHADKDNALVRRLKGEALPLPCNANETMAAVILKACAFAPKDRYTSATQLREDLEAISAGLPLRYASVDALYTTASQNSDSALDASGPTVGIFGDSSDVSVTTASVFGDNAAYDATVSDFGGNTYSSVDNVTKTAEIVPSKKKKKKWPLILLLLLLLLGTLATAAWYVVTQTDLLQKQPQKTPEVITPAPPVQDDPIPSVKIPTLSEASFELLIGESKKLEISNAEGKVAWVSSAPSVATVENGTITAVGHGTATITVSASNGTAQCTVLVQEKIIPVTEVTLNQKKLDLFVGDSAALVAAIAPSDATNTIIIWSSSKPAVATVDDAGNIQAKAVGTTVITAKVGEKLAACTITVQEKTISVSGIALNQTSLGLEVGKSASLTATISPANATDKSITWSSSDNSVATVLNGKITAQKAGTAIITATVGGKSVKCTVTVTSKAVEVYGVSLNKNSVNLTEGDTFTLTATLLPDEASYASVYWSSSNPSIATVVDGIVTAESAGVVTITATAGSCSDVCTVYVKAKVVEVTAITLSKTSLNLIEDDTVSLTATVYPSNATDKTVTWKSSDGSVARINNGTVTAWGPGTAIITAFCGSYSASCTVTVKTPVKSVLIREYSIGGSPIGSMSLYASISPSNATNKTVTWTSNNPSVASVDSSGKVTANRVGEAVITATVDGVSDTYPITISESYSIDQLDAAWVPVTQYRYGCLYNPNYGRYFFCEVAARGYCNIGTWTEDWTDWSFNKIKPVEEGLYCPNASHSHSYTFSGGPYHSLWYSYYLPNGLKAYGEETRTVYRYLVIN